MAGAFYKGGQHVSGLASIGYRCTGHMPWLGKIGETAENCDVESVSIVQRGASNVWFADTISSIFIPLDKEDSGRRVIEVLENRYSYIFGTLVDGKIDRERVKIFAEIDKVDPDMLLQAALRRAEGLETLNKIDEETSEDEYRLTEYQVLRKNSGDPQPDFHSKNLPIEKYSLELRPYFSSISKVPILKETRVLAGFSRLEPNMLKSRSEKRKMLRSSDENWLPAIEVRGEGIFFEFKRAALTGWAKRPDVKERIILLRDAYKNSFFYNSMPGELNAEYVMIHTFSHLLINQLSYECGYGSSSIRERLYCERCGDDRHMNGLLIYTASGDSEGSLGGLVRQGEPDRIENIVQAAIENARWCSSDPICIESLGQGPESTNLAACHNCALLPETSCEVGNRLLDRALIIGTRNNPDLGYFHDMKI